MSSELIFKGASLALDLIEYAAANKANETGLFLELGKPQYDGFTEDQKMAIVERITDTKLDTAQAAINAIANQPTSDTA